MTCVTLDGTLVWSSAITNSRTPVHGDGNILVDQILTEQRENLTNGIWDFLCVPPGFRIKIILDKGFEINPLNYRVSQKKV